MSINYKNIILCLLILCSLSCKEPNSKLSSKENPEDQTVEGAHGSENESPGTKYKQEEIDKLVQASLPKKKVKIDTFSSLHEFPEALFQWKDYSRITYDTVLQHLEIDNPLSESQKKLLYATDYFCSLPAMDTYTRHLLYRKSDESHFGNAIDLIHISKTDNSFFQLTLAEFYGHESYEKITSSQNVGNKKIFRSFQESYGPRNEKGEMDENSQRRLSQEIYEISESGEFIMISIDI